MKTEFTITTLQSNHYFASNSSLIPNEFLIHSHRIPHSFVPHSPLLFLLQSYVTSVAVHE